MLPSKLEVKYRDTWPTHVPFYVEFAVQTWWPADTTFRTEIVPRLDGSQALTIDMPRTAYGFVAPEDFQGNEIVFDVTTELLNAGHSSPRTVQTETIRVPVKRQGVLADHTRPVSSPELDAAMAAMSFTIGRNELAPDSRSIETQLFRNVAIGAQFEYMLDDQVIVSQSNWWPGGEPIRLFRPGETNGDVDRLMMHAQPGEHWTLRIRSDPAMALRVFDHSHYWEGDVTISLTIMGE